MAEHQSGAGTSRAGLTRLTDLAGTQAPGKVEPTQPCPEGRPARAEVREAWPQWLYREPGPSGRAAGAQPGAGSGSGETAGASPARG